MQLDNFDLNLLKVLNAVLSEKSISRAAEKLGVSQPSVSRSIARIREELNDPIFTRSKNTLTLTPRAESMAITLPLLLDGISQSLQAPVFDPSQLEGDFRLAMNGYIAETLGYRICDAIRRHCPNLDLELHSYGAKTLDLISDGILDAGLDFYPLETTKSIRQTPLGTLEFGCICRAGHPLDGGTVAMEEVVNYELGALTVPGHAEKRADFEQFLKPGFKIKSWFRSHYSEPILEAVRHSDMLFPAPILLGEKLNNRRFGLIQHPENALNRFRDFGFIYHNKNTQQPLFKWLESLLKTEVQSLYR